MASPLSSGRRVDDRFRLARIGRGLSQAALAERAGVTRQAITGIESGHWSPSLEVALALAGALGSSVEELFGPAPTFPPIEVQLATGATEGARLLLSGVGGEQVGFPLEGDHALVPGFRPALAGAPAAGSAAAGSRVAAHPFVLPGPTVVVAGCDPALALLAGPLERHRPPVGLVWWNCGNSAGRALLEAGHAHVAAVHRRRDEATRPPGQYEAVSFAAWREGLAVSPRYAGRVQDLGDALELGLRLANREPGSEARRLVDEALAGIEADTSALRGYETVCSAHLLVTSAIAAGLADVGVTSEPAALAYGLGFVPWQEEVCELWVPRKLLGDTEVRALLDVLASGEVSAQLAAIAGYDNGPCGRLVV